MGMRANIRETINETRCKIAIIQMIGRDTEDEQLDKVRESLSMTYTFEGTFVYFDAEDAAFTAAIRKHTHSELGRFIMNALNHSHNLLSLDTTYDQINCRSFIDPSFE